MPASIIQTLKNLLTGQTSDTPQQPATLEQSSREPTPIALPPQLRLQLEAAIRSLDNHPDYAKAVVSGLNKALNQWRNQPGAPNCLVVIGSPVEDLMGIVNDTVDLDGGDGVEVVRLCQDWSGRLLDYGAIAPELQQELEHLDPSNPSPPSDTLVLLPLLDWCFLRCVEGLDGVEVLRDVVSRDRHRFWLMGCNSWAWNYLDRVCQVSAYFDQTFLLPQLDGWACREWLAPVAEDYQVSVVDEFSSPAKTLARKLEHGSKTDTAQQWGSRAEKDYFETLAHDAHGLSRVAAELWLRSLSLVRQPSEDSESDKSGDSKADAEAANSAEEDLCDAPRRVRRSQIDTPKLPALPGGDRYLLYSLLLHGSISLPHLALSLGDEESLVQARVQVLHREGLIFRHHGQWRVDPAYYQDIRSDLERNNFLVGDTA